MVSWTFRSFFLSAVFVVASCDRPGVQLLENLIETSNNHLSEKNLTEMLLPDTSWFFEAIQFQQGRLGSLDSVQLQPDPKIVSHINHYGTVYTYNFRAGLKNLTVNYQFHLNIPFFGKYGNVIITVGRKSFQIEGSILVKHDGTCFAKLQDVKVVQFGDFNVKFEPDNTPFITKIYQAVLNVIDNQIIPIINTTIRKEIATKYFRQKFTELACAQVTLNSTTEASTTN
nr:uncharacterized protein LOC106684271 [Halyomorpha halys]